MNVKAKISGSKFNGNLTAFTTKPADMSHREWSTPVDAWTGYQNSLEMKF